MRKVISLLLLFVSQNLWAQVQVPNQAQPLQKVKADHLQLNVYANQSSVQAGSAFYLALEFQMDPEWHIYWKNPGDSGAALKIDWQSENSKFTKIDWPYPERIVLDPLTNFGYEPSVIFPVQIQVNANATNTLKAKMHLEWLVCKVECTPGFQDIEIQLPIASSAVTNLEVEKILQANEEKLPQAVPHKIHFLEQTDTNYKFALTVPSVKPQDIKELQFFPVEKGIFVNSPPVVDLKNNTIEITLNFDENHPKKLPALNGLFVLKLIDGTTKNFETQISPNQGTAANWWKALLFAFMGGIILNLMPCVFPVLSIKILSFMGEDKNPKKLRKSGWFYTLGVLVAFAILSLILLSLRQAGESLGWGFQLQSSGFVFALALLFTILAFNFLGFFAIGESFIGTGSKLQTKSGNLGSFFTGLLSTVVASPCTAPFMGSAIGVSLSLPFYQAFFIFMAIGVGLALPFLLLAYFPHALKILPRPGRWMETLKEFFAFPLFLTVIWLLWVLSLQKGETALLYYLAIFTWIAFLIWLSHKTKKLKTLPLVILVLIPAAWSVMVVHQLDASISQQAIKEEVWNKYDEAAVNEAVKNNQAVFINFTASWCLTCQVNKKLVLHKEETLQLFKDNHVKLFEADWTNQDPVITQALQKLGRNALPVYVFYPPNAAGKSILLPEILTLATIKQLFDNKENL